MTAARDFPRAQPSGNPEEQLCKPEENLVLPNSFTQLNIIFAIGLATFLNSNSTRSIIFFCKANLAHF